MPHKTIKPGSPKDWLRHAKSDLILARSAKSREVLYSHLCFHAQQSAEKAVKAVLVAHGVCFPRTHDVAYLLDLLPEPEKPPVVLAGLPLLTKYAVQQRYPGNYDIVTAAERRRAVNLAAQAVVWAEKKIRCG